MTEIIIVAICVAFFLWMIWRLIISRIFNNQRILNAVIVLLIIANIILLIFSFNKMNIIALVAFIVFGVMDYVLNSGLIEFREGILELLDERRMTIDLWQDMIIDMCIVALVIQICSIAISL